MVITIVIRIEYQVRLDSFYNDSELKLLSSYKLASIFS